MTAASGPTLAEVARRLDEAVTEFKGLRSDLERTYVRQDVYEREKELSRQAVREAAANALLKADAASALSVDNAHRLDVLEVEKQNEAAFRANTRRLASLAILSAFLTPLVAAVLYKVLGQ